MGRSHCARGCTRKCHEYVGVQLLLYSFPAVDKLGGQDLCTCSRLPIRLLGRKDRGHCGVADETRVARPASGFRHHRLVLSPIGLGRVGVCPGIPRFFPIVHTTSGRLRRCARTVWSTAGRHGVVRFLVACTVHCRWRFLEHGAGYDVGHEGSCTLARIFPV